MATKKDYYDVLGVSRGSSSDEIKSAYRRMALKYHPDRNQGKKESEEKFKEINEAYEVLSNSEKKNIYDQYGHAGVQGGAGAGGFGGDFSGFGDVFSDFFGDVFGGGRGRRQKVRKGEDLQYEHVISLNEAFKGTESKIRVPHHTPCSVCNGAGAKPGTSTKVCPDCRGAGQVRVTRGFFTLAQTCPRCQGGGQIVEHPCTQCHGQGRVKVTETIKVRIPAGVEDETALRVSGAGEAGGRGAVPGDLYVVVRVKEDKRFQRQGENLLTGHSIRIPLAVLGGEVEIPTLEKPVKINIPAGTQSGTLFRVRGSGMPHLRGSGRGDLFVKVKVDIPTKLSKEQKQLFNQLAESFSGKKNGKDESILKKVFGK